MTNSASFFLLTPLNKIFTAQGVPRQRARRTTLLTQGDVGLWDSYASSEAVLVYVRVYARVSAHARACTCTCVVPEIPTSKLSPNHQVSSVQMPFTWSRVHSLLTKSTLLRHRNDFDVETDNRFWCLPFSSSSLMKESMVTRAGRGRTGSICGDLDPYPSG